MASLAKQVGVAASRRDGVDVGEVNEGGMVMWSLLGTGLAVVNVERERTSIATHDATSAIVPVNI